MKKFLTTAVLLFILHNVFSQEKNQYYEMLNVSFLKYIDCMDQNRKQIIITRGGMEVDPIRFDNGFIALDYLPMGFELSQEILAFGFRGVYLNSVKARKLLKKPRGFVFVDGPNIIKDTIDIYISSREVVRKDKIVNIVISASVKCRWTYCYQAAKWQLLYVESRGI